MALTRKGNVRLPPEVNRILYVRNLPYKITAEEMYDIFGKYGAIRQIRDSRDMAVMVFSGSWFHILMPVCFPILEVVKVRLELSGIRICSDGPIQKAVVRNNLALDLTLEGKSYDAFKKTDDTKKKEDIEKMKQKYGLSTPEKK
ncbi:splicing factor 3B subunit 6-like [Saccostrea cucullata]|uniref:splicing factor 3B subunit 6-like n=1 Tax=Saccostrea cuccullata TaxID=36930 RepID=UPI002ED1FD57